MWKYVVLKEKNSKPIQSSIMCHWCNYRCMSQKMGKIVLSLYYVYNSFYVSGLK